jgi:glycosyltransferase involved in cell wall biosynthesis
MNHIAITLSTYKREDGKTPFYLKRCLDSIFAQKYKDFKVFLAGDFYEDGQEWESVIKPYLNEQFCAFNLNTPGERIKYRNNKMALWCSGGTFACNLAIDKALEEGFKYICHIDHDDYWTEDHLYFINKCIKETNADWMCTRSVYGSGGGLLPKMNSNELYIPFLPVGGGLINSSNCYNFQTIPIRGEDTFETRGEIIPADADLWDRINIYMKENNCKGIFINRTTCYHTEEGHNLR